MDLEEYKKEVEDCLRNTVGEENQEYITSRMRLYENEFPTFLKENWSPAGVAAAIVMGY